MAISKMSLQILCLLWVSLSAAILKADALKLDRDAEGLRVLNSEISFLFAEEKDGMGLLGITHLKDNSEFIKRPNNHAEAKLWRVVVTNDRSKPDEFIKITNRDKCLSKKVEIIDNVIVFSWSGFDVPGVEDAFDVYIHVSNWRDTSMTDWRIEVVNRSEDYGIWHIYGPILELSEIGQSGDDDYLILPPAEGRSVRDPIHWDQNQKNERTIHDLTTDLEPVKIKSNQPATGFGFGAQEPYGCPYPTGRGQIQLCAYYEKQGSYYYPSKDKGAGLYLASHDSTARPKVFYATNHSDKELLNFTFGSFPDDSAKPGMSYEQEFPYIIGAFNGDWYDAAQIYKSWAKYQLWCVRGTLAQRDDIPQWLKRTTAWVRLDRHPISRCEESMDLYRENLQGHLGIQWYHWEEGMRRAKAQAGYFPPRILPREGVKDFIGKYQQRNCHVFPYINTRLWGKGYEKTNIPEFVDFEIAEPYIQKNADGSMSQWKSGATAQTKARMCLFSEFWQNYLTDACRQLVKGYAVDGIYLDQAGEMSYGGGYYEMQGCHDASHGHPLGITEALKQVEYSRIERVLEECHIYNNDVIITGEGSAEPYLDIVNNKLIHYEIWPGYVPVYGAVYHEYQTYYGRNINFTAKNPQDPLPKMQIGWQLILGNQLARLHPTAYDELNALEKKHFDYLKQATAVKDKYFEYLSLGRMLRPPYLSEVPDVTTAEFKRINHLCTLPAILGSVWKTPDGNIGAIFTNISEEKVDFNFALNLKDYSISKGKYELVQVFPEVRTLSVNSKGRWVDADMSLESMDIIFIGIQEK